MEALGIGPLARRGGIGIDTVRNYEPNGLLAPSMKAPTRDRFLCGK